VRLVRALKLQLDRVEGPDNTKGEVSMFNKAGSVAVKITEVKFTEARFAENDDTAFDVCIHVEALDGSGADWWRGEVSGNYGKGAVSHMTQRELTFGTLKKLGFEREDLSTLADALVGTETVANIKETSKDGKTYYNVQSLGSAGAGKEIDAGEMKRRLAALTGGNGGGAKPTASASATAKPDPFKNNGTTSGPKKNPFAK